MWFHRLFVFYFIFHNYFLGTYPHSLVFHDAVSMLGSGIQTIFEKFIKIIFLKISIHFFFVLAISGISLLVSHKYLGWLQLWQRPRRDSSDFQQEEKKVVVAVTTKRQIIILNNGNKPSESREIWRLVVTATKTCPTIALYRSVGLSIDCQK